MPFGFGLYDGCCVAVRKLLYCGIKSPIKMFGVVLRITFAMIEQVVWVFT
jgi:hypothetical protein